MYVSNLTVTVYSPGFFPFILQWQNLGVFTCYSVAITLLGKPEFHEIRKPLPAQLCLEIEAQTSLYQKLLLSVSQCILFGIAPGDTGTGKRHQKLQFSQTGTSEIFTPQQNLKSPPDLTLNGSKSAEASDKGDLTVTQSSEHPPIELTVNFGSTFATFLMLKQVVKQCVVGCAIYMYFESRHIKRTGVILGCQHQFFLFSCNFRRNLMVLLRRYSNLQ